MRFIIDWASLIAGRKFTVLALCYFLFEGNFPSTSPRGAYNFALPVWGAYIWRGLFSEFYGMNTFFVVSILLSGEANKIKQKLKKTST